MSLIVSASNEGSFKPVPPGMHLARCYRIVDLGTQKTEWQGQVKQVRKITVNFEVHGQDDEGHALVTSKGEPMTISKNYSLSLGENSGLRKDLKGWRGRDFTGEELKGFDLKNILGVWAMISVIQTEGRDGKTYTNIGSINPVMAALKSAGMPPYHNKAEMFSISNPDMALFESFNDNLKAKIAASPEWARMQSAKEAPQFDSEDDDIPF